MKNLKTKIILPMLSLAIFVSMFGFANLASAAGTTSSYLNVAPTNQIKTAGSIFSTSINIKNNGNKVCTVEGTLMLNNLTCQSITIPDDVQSLSVPTCSKPYFNIGIPNCVMTDKLLMTISAKTGSVGTASISANNVEMIGVVGGSGDNITNVGSSLTPANYTVVAPVVAVATPVKVASTTVEVPKKVTETTVTKTVTTVTETDQNIALAPTGSTTSTNSNVAIATSSENSLVASVGQIAPALMGSKLFSYLLGILSAILIYEIYVFIKRKKSEPIK
jgi:hypothetical protein